MISIKEFEEIYNLIPGEPAFELWFDEDGPSYMIIKYADCATFQRCGNGPRSSGEFEYPSLNALLSTDLLDGLNLRRDWSRIQGIIASDSWRLNSPNDLQHLKQHYHRN